MVHVSIARANPERDHTSSRLARRVRMSDFEDFVAPVFLRHRQPESPLAKAVGIDQATTRRIFYRYRDGWRAGSASSAIHDGSRHRRCIPPQQKTTNAGQQKMAKWRGA